MQNADTLFAVMRSRGEKGQPVERLYRMLFNQNLYLRAYAKLYHNRGTMTPGATTETVDEMSLKKTDSIIEAIKYERYQWTPVRRTYIRKANGKLRPLGLPTWLDKLLQEVIRFILEAYYEPQFSLHSHGFRPQKGCHTALLEVQHTWTGIKWIIEGDISSYFDHIQHKILMRLLKRRIKDKKLLTLVWKMLKAGVMEGTLFKTTPEGTPQGGIVSPLLANIYLHELDKWMDEKYTGLNYNEKNRRRRRKEGNAFYVRYADDFVITWNGTKENAQKLKSELSAFLSEHLGLQLSEEKTHITHITEGFDFLGFTLKRHIDEQRGYNELRSYPSKKSVMKLKGKIKDMTKRGTTLASPRDKITALNLLLQGWANYYRHTAASSTFSYVGSYAFKRMELWLRKKTRLRVRAVYKKYYRRNRWLTWEAGGEYLYHTSMTTIEYKRYAHRPNPYLNPEIPVRLPYHIDPYPGKREWDGINSTYGENWTDKRDEVRRRDGNRCTLCESKDRVEIHHIRKHKGDSEHTTDRLIALCATCHRNARNPQHEVSRRIAKLYLRTGKPDEAKVSRPVWEDA